MKNNEGLLGALTLKYAVIDVRLALEFGVYGIVLEECSTTQSEPWQTSSEYSSAIG
jgi:hypothetical protein